MHLSSDDRLLRTQQGLRFSWRLINNTLLTSFLPGLISIYEFLTLDQARAIELNHSTATNIYQRCHKS